MISEKINPQSLKPAALMRILNTAGFGTVITEHRLRRHRNRAGYAIGSEKTINLFQYAAWLTLEYLWIPVENRGEFRSRIPVENRGWVNPVA